MNRLNTTFGYHQFRARKCEPEISNVSDFAGLKARVELFTLRLSARVFEAAVRGVRRQLVVKLKISSS